jgi:hypothetical protein
MAAINNIEIFGSVCRETNPPAINIKRGKDKQAQEMSVDLTRKASKLIIYSVTSQ